VGLRDIEWRSSTFSASSSSVSVTGASFGRAGIPSSGAVYPSVDDPINLRHVDRSASAGLLPAAKLPGPKNSSPLLSGAPGTSPAPGELFTVNDYRDRIYADVLQIPRSVTRVADKEIELHGEKVKEDESEEEDDV